MDGHGQRVSTTERVFTSARDGKVLTLYSLLCNKSKLAVNRILSHATEEDEEKTTPLIIAARNGHDKVVNVLLDYFDVNIEQTGTVKSNNKGNVVIEGATALWCAARTGHGAVVKALTEKGANVNYFAPISTPVRAACISGHMDIVKYLIEHNADWSIANKDNQTCLMVASGNGHDDIVGYLLQSGHDPNAKDINGTTALHYAAQNGFLKLTEKLLHYGALTIVNKNNNTCLMVASYNGHDDIVEYLLQSGHDPNLEDINGKTALHYAAQEGFLKITEKLLHYGALSIVNNCNNTCLMVASYNGHYDIVDYLLQSKHDPNAKDIYGRTALHYAAQDGFLQITEKLVYYGAKMTTDDKGMTPLTDAAYYGHVDIVDLFVTSHFCTRLEQIDALDLLGAHFGMSDEDDDIDKCFHYLWLAMSARYSDPEEIHHKKLGPPVPAYENRLECQNLAELEAIKDDFEALDMEVLIVLERILGKSHPKYLNVVHNRGEVFVRTGRHSCGIALLLRALNLRPESDTKMSVCLLNFVNLFSQMINKGMGIDFSLAEVVFERLLFELGSLQERPVTVTDKTKKEALDELNDSIMHIALYLMVILNKISHTEKQELCVCEFEDRFNGLNLRLKSKQSYTPLHMACDAMTTVDDPAIKQIVTFPSEIIVNRLLKCGADVNEIDSDGNSPLHLLLITYNEPVGESKFLHNMIMSLLEAGALANRYEKRLIYNCYRTPPVIPGALYRGFGYKGLGIGPRKESFFRDKAAIKESFFKDKSAVKMLFFNKDFH